MINYRVQKIEALIKKLKDIGLTIIDKMITCPFGMFVHILDIEGYVIELGTKRGFY
ncbi:MAG: bleomycin resistance protein [Flavobacteriaceae bacterium]|nr:bleomycin resistance protein [Flavobacteriaceae bacterium]|tara:strand:- start:249 stop:416 length:168 start_codon:yes stop_codon:yes gene_type:complete